MRFVSAAQAIGYTSTAPPSLIHMYDTQNDQWYFPWEVVPLLRSSPTTVMIEF